MKLNKSLEPADFAASLVDLLFRPFSHSSTRAWTQELAAKESFWHRDFGVGAGRVWNASTWKALQLLRQVTWLDPVQCSECASAEKKMMSRVGNSARSKETTTLWQPSSLSLAAGARPKLGLHSSEVHLHSANTLQSCCVFREKVPATVFPWIPGCERRPKQALHAPRVPQGSQEGSCKNIWLVALALHIGISFTRTWRLLLFQLLDLCLLLSVGSAQRWLLLSLQSLNSCSFHFHLSL